jgi:hypothetical protein
MQHNIKNINQLKVQIKKHNFLKPMNLIICHMQMLKNNKNKKANLKKQ